MRKIILSAAVLLPLSLAVVSCGSSLKVQDLRCEGLDQPLAIDSAEPHFSWKISSETTMSQSSFQIQVASTLPLLKSGAPDLWDSGQVQSPDQVMVPYGGKALPSRTLAWWRVRVAGQDGKFSPWSKPRRFGTGVIGGDSLKGDFIGAVPGEGRSPLLRKKFSFSGKKGTAILYVNSLGYHEASINGRKVSEAVLAPAVSQLDKRSLIVAYDVTDLLRKGENELLVRAGAGWYNKRTYGSEYEGPLVKAEIDLFSDEGFEPVVWTDASWEGAWSGRSDLTAWWSGSYGGERIDAGVVPEWGPVDVVNPGNMAATPQMCEPCTVQEVLTAVSIEPAGENRWLVDFGKVVNAMTAITLPALPAGHKTTAVYSESVRDVTNRNDFGWDEFISSGNKDGDRFESLFNHHIFRYIYLENLPEAPAREAVQARRMRTDYVSEASFRCSDKELCKIHDMVAWTMENLSFDGYMVDCASIERLGYGGDGNASTLSLQTRADVAPLYMNWLQAWNDVIREDGGLPHTAPCPLRAGGGPYWCSFIVQAPWRTYMSYDDDRLLHRCYPTMKHWLDYVDAHTVGGLLKRWPDTGYRSWYLGDWAAPDGVDVTAEASVDLVNNCALLQSYSDLGKIASLLGCNEDAEEFDKRYQDLSALVHKTFYHPEDSTYATGTQVDMVYPMLVGAVPDSLVPAVREKLFRRTEEVYGGHLSTGLVGIPVLTEWATLAGEADWFYGMLKKHGYPGYLYMLDNGATGTWEHWNGARSLLHNCFNGIGSWFYQALGGIIPDEPGFRHVTVAPQVPAGLEWVEVTQGTPYGKISVSRHAGHLSVDIPVGVTATIAGNEYPSGHHEVELDL